MKLHPNEPAIDPHKNCAMWIWMILQCTCTKNYKTILACTGVWRHTDAINFHVFFSTFAVFRSPRFRGNLEGISVTGTGAVLLGEFGSHAIKLGAGQAQLSAGSIAISAKRMCWKWTILKNAGQKTETELKQKITDQYRSLQVRQQWAEKSDK